MLENYSCSWSVEWQVDGSWLVQGRVEMEENVEGLEGCNGGMCGR